MRRPHRRGGYGIGRHLVLLVLLILIATPALSGDKSAITSDAKRQARIQELHREQARIEQELRELRAQPEGVAQSTAPRSELTEQPKRSMEESLESLPGVSARQGPSGRDVQLSIRGTK